MIISKKQATNPAALKGWVTAGDQYEFTSNREVIEEEVQRLVSKRIWVEIRMKGYRSAPTLVVSLKKNRMEIDRPRDWPPSKDITIIYRHVKGPWHFLQAEVDSVSKNAIWTHLPYVFIILERREHFRISVPSDSEVRIFFDHGGAKKEVVGEVLDVSLGGLAALISHKKNVTLPGIRSVVGPIELNLKLDNNTSWEPIILSKAEVVRITQPMRGAKNKKKYALKFICPVKESDQLWPYIRKRELLLLRG